MTTKIRNFVAAPARAACLSVAALTALFLFAFAAPPAGAAESPANAATGAIEGRVFNPGTGEYLEKARVTVEGAGLETLTDSLGQYSFANVPAGEVRVKVFYTGLVVQTAPVRVTAGQTEQRDFNLAGFEPEPAVPGAPIKLDQFVVSTSREMDGAAIAINEKRFAADIRNVIAADEFGPMADGNVGEILKTVPGVALDYVGGAAMNISLNGVPSGYVPVTMNGFPLASTTATAPTARDVELINVATNNLSRIEVLHTPTPESPGNALAGSVNMVPRGAFERVKPVFNANVYVLMRDDVRDLKKTPGPTLGSTSKVHPGFDFSYVAPVNKRFGYTLSGGTSQQYQPTYFVQANWRGVSAPTTVAATATTGFPATTFDKPYLTDYLIRDQPRQSRRSSAGVTLDYRFSPADRISVSFQAARFDAQYNQRDLTFAITRVLPGNFSPSFTHGAAGFGTLTLASANDRDRRNASNSPSIIYRHDGPIWTAQAGAGWSLSKSEIRNLGKGFFAAVNATRPNVTISFDDIFYLRPGRVTVTDGTTGAPVDPYTLGTYNIQSASGHRYGADTVLGVGPGEGIANKTSDVQRNAYVNLKRDFSWPAPLTLKAGLDLRQSQRDYRGGTTALTFVGADGRAASGDENAAPFLDPLYSDRDGVFGFPKTQRIAAGKLWDFYRANPQSFTKNDDAIYRSAITLSKYAEEVISSAYVRGDVALRDRRLKLTGGVRAEQTNVTAAGPLNDLTRNYQRDARGTILRAANGQPLRIVPATDALGGSKLTFIERGARAQKEYLRWFPNLNASYGLRENLVARAAYYYSIGRPDYNQYAGGITLPDEALPPSPNNRIGVSNVAIKPWTAKTTKVSLEYYFERVGLVSIGAFRRDFENFFGSTVFAATPEFLALYDLDPTQWGAYDVATQFNVTSMVRSEGYDVQYKQALTFLPPWARGVQIFANGAVQRMTGPAAAVSFSGFIPKTATWGVSLSRPKYSLKVNWNYKSRHRRAAINGASIPPGTYVFGSKRLFVDLIGEYSLTRHFALFGNIRNLRDTPEDFSRDGPEMPDVAKFRQRDRYGALWIFGVKSTF
ncbi:MAG: carboxypeptidase regulatory-like domain-containing protein [Verrucomicrobia bacterium]|nr:carboxypeptidase regulatory-like domain-containing protein [Verrucomicrobiota bacterium]